MSNMRVFTDKGLDYIHQNMSEFFELMKNNRNDSNWIKDFCKRDPTTSSPFDFDFHFETNSLNPSESEFNNAVNLYELFKNNKIGNAVIYNEKFAAGFMYSYGYDYFFWASDLAKETRVSATFFFDYRSGIRMALARQLMTRLYRVAESTVLEDSEDKYELTRFVFDHPALRRIVYRPNLDGYKSSRAFVKAFKKWNELDPKNNLITMNLFDKIAKQYSAFANVNMTECVEEESIISYLINCLNNSKKK